MPIIICPNCQKETEVLPPYFRCASCQSIIYDESINKNNEQNTANHIAMPEGLNHNLMERPSIKHKIKLKKEPLPWEKAIEPEKKPIVVETPKEEIAPVLPPKPKEEIIIIETEAPQNEDLSNLMDLFAEAKKEVKTEIKTETQKETATESSLDVSFDNFNISKDGIDLNNKENKPKIQNPQPEIPNPKSPDDLIMWDVMSEIEERDKKLSQFLTTENQEVEQKKSAYFSPPPIPKIENRVGEKAGKKELAWLIRHTEGKEPVFYALYEGENVIGKTTTVIPTDVAIADDVYVSYGHAVLRIYEVPPAIYLFELRDDGSKRPDKKPSLNGTYVNAHTPAISKPTFLNDGDTFQVGLTQFVLKISSSKFPDMASIIQAVLRKPYMPIIK